VRGGALTASLSHAADLGMGLPAYHAVSTCVLGLRLGNAMGFDTDTLHHVCYETLLPYMGCRADVQWYGSLLSDELAFLAEYAMLDTANVPAVMELIQRSIRSSGALTRTIDTEEAVNRALGELSLVMGSFLPGHCVAPSASREVEVIGLLAGGGRMKEATARLDIADPTVSRHTQSIYTRIGLRTRAGATLWAVGHGLT
jgi:DNA-binding CsgD family transcriptional regulator